MSHFSSFFLKFKSSLLVKSAASSKGRLHISQCKLLVLLY